MIRVLELFAGIGACSKALTNLGVEHEIVDAVEIDKYAVQSFNAVHGTDFEPQDITKWDKDIECDLIMHGSPCQDFSVAGKGAGGDKDSGTRSSLMYETLRIVEKLKPKYVIWENVKNLLSKKHRHNFDAYLEAMERLGYRSQYQVLNAKDYGVPQNRERVFTVSIRNDLDVDFGFPKPQELTIRLKDVLEPQVDEKYYLSDEQVSKIKLWEDRQRENGRGFRFNAHDGDSIATTMTTSADRPSTSNYYKDPKEVRVAGKLNHYNYDKMDRVYETDGLAPTVDTMEGGGRQPKIIARTDEHQKGGVYETEAVSPTITATNYKQPTQIAEPTPLQRKVCNEAIAKGLVEPNDAVEYTYSNARLKEIENGYIKKQNNKDNSVMSTLKCNPQQIGVCVGDSGGVAIRTANKQGYDTAVDGDGVDLSYPQSKTRRGRVGHGVSKTLMGGNQMGAVDNYRIRKLTPKECWRLMGFDDSDFDKAKSSGVSNSQLYKQAGNSIVVKVLEGILRNLLTDQ